MTSSHSQSIRTTAIAFAAGAAMGVGAQMRMPVESDKVPDPPGKVVSDAAPLPAESRDSHGAIVLRDDPVRAQAAAAAAAAGERTGVTSVVGRRVTRLLERVRSWDDVREAEATPAADPTRSMGGPPSPR